MAEHWEALRAAGRWDVTVESSQGDTSSSFILPGLGGLGSGAHSGDWKS